MTIATLSTSSNETEDGEMPDGKHTKLDLSLNVTKQYLDHASGEGKGKRERGE